MGRIVLEIACASVADAVGAARGDADRIELCSALELEGLTPSVGMLAAVRRRVPLPIVAMVRPRAGDAVYTSAEWGVMEADAAILLEWHADGIVFGALDAKGRVDERRCRGMVRLAAGAQVVFHRAFDVATDPFAALEVLIACGVTRVLTSGGAPTALEGAGRLRELIERADGRIDIVPGGGIRESNVEEVVRQTGCTAVHLSRR
jgi:copper homeostasis protein